MLKAKFPFKVIVASLVLTMVSTGAECAEKALDASQLKKHEGGFYRETFDNNLFYEAVNYLYLDRLYRAVTGKKRHAQNVNIFDEVPDSSFYENRHEKKKLSLDQLRDGAKENDGPDLSGDITVIKGKFSGMHPGFLIKDGRGDLYLVKFDSVDSFELATSAEVVASRFYHALGYHVPQYTIETFEFEQLVPSESATIYDSTGFKKKLTPERLEEYLLFVPQDETGRYRVSASKILEGESKGPFWFYGTRGKDPDDTVDHEDRREIRALQVFASWLNNYDARDGNTLDLVVNENGQDKVKHYLIDFNASLGAGTDGAKPPMFSHEHMLDFGETTKAFLSLGLWEKPWQSRWQEVGERVDSAPAVGYFDNRYFEPNEFKTQLPFHAFKDLTKADAIWATRRIINFSNDEIKAIVGTGAYSNPEDADVIAKTLIERRNIIAKYWFRQGSPLDAFDYNGSLLTFRDLGTFHQLEQQEGSQYHVEVTYKKKKKYRKIEFSEVNKPALEVSPSWFDHGPISIFIRTQRADSDNLGGYVRVDLSKDQVVGIYYED